VREPLVAYAGDCIVRGDVELGEGRLSDEVNDHDILTFVGATLEALEDGHEVTVDQLDVERGDLHLIEIRGRRGDPIRRLRTVAERVVLEVGPYLVTGNLHRPPNLLPLAALHRASKFVPVTDAVFAVGGDAAERQRDVLLVNRERISGSRPLDNVPSRPGDSWDVSPAG
jgi:hypothetical protein